MHIAKIAKLLPKRTTLGVYTVQVQIGMKCPETGRARVHGCSKRLNQIGKVCIRAKWPIRPEFVPVSATLSG